MIAARSRWYRVYDSTYGYDEHNPGRGDTRFAPLHDVDESAIPSMYLASSPTAALLETVLHDLTDTLIPDRVISERVLREKMLAHVEVPVPVKVLDLRDAALAKAGIDRAQLITTSAEHYACTRRVARELHAAHPAAQGLVWHSRQAEIAGMPVPETLVVFGDRYPSGRGTWRRVGPGVRSLFEGPGRLVADRLMEQLDVTVQLMDARSV